MLIQRSPRFLAQVPAEFVDLRDLTATDRDESKSENELKMVQKYKDLSMTISDTFCCTISRNSIVDVCLLTNYISTIS